MSEVLELDPGLLADLVGRSVEVETKAGRQHHGKCLSVDPVSGSLIVLKKDKLLLLPWVDHAAVKVIKTEGTCKASEDLDFWLDLLSRKDLTGSKNGFSEHDNQSLDVRRHGLETWLKQNHLSVQTVANSIIVQDGLVMIDPPYEACDCKSTNDIVLQRVASIVASFQPEVEN